jgi:hypothetical protein
VLNGDQPLTRPHVERPFGVTVLALFYLFGGVAFLIILATAILRPAGGSGSILGHDIPTVHKYEVVYPILILFFAGMLVLFSLAHAVGSQRTLGTFFWFAGTINCWMFLYLRLPHVKEAFRMSQT